MSADQRDGTRRGARLLAWCVGMVVTAAFVLGATGSGAAVAGGDGQSGHGLGSVPAWGGLPARLGAVVGRASIRPGVSPGLRASRGARTVSVGGNPVSVAVDQATHTAYVGNGNDNTVSVINTATCNAHLTRGCGQTPPTVAVGPGPVDAAVDEKTDTVYVVNLGSNTVSVIDGSTCNASHSSGCGQPPATITVGAGPDGIAVDEATDTVYVANYGPNGDGSGHTVSVINGAICNGRVTSGCGQAPATVRVGRAPAVPAVNDATDTVYVPNSNPSGLGSVSVIDGATCNATHHSGCGHAPPRVSVGFLPNAAAVDRATNTVYVTANPTRGTTTKPGSVYVINGGTCNARVTSGCGQAPPIVTVGSGPIDVVVDTVTKSVFVVNQEDSTVSIVDEAICNARHTAGCSQHPPVVETGFDPGYLDVELATNTVYVANQDENTVSVLNGGACTLNHQSGCRHEAPTTTVGGDPWGIATNLNTDTVYVTSQSDNDLSVINAVACNAGHRRGCDRLWPTVATGAFPSALAVNRHTDTVYVANTADGTVSVIDGATCNAHVTWGCRKAAATVVVGNGPFALAVNEATNTVYVANGDANTVSVIDGATCNATRRSGCGHTPATITVGNGPFGVAVNQATDTVYVTNNGDNTVSVVNGATCNATTKSGCGHTPAIVSVGTAPASAAVNQATHTVYVANSVDHTLSVINGARCNATHHSGCDQTPPTMTTGGLPFGVAVDQTTNTVYVASIIDSATDVFNGATCNASVTSGCAQTPMSVPMGGWPSNVAVNQKTNTVYVSLNVDGEVSFFRRTAR